MERKNKFRGKYFSEEEIEKIREIIRKNPGISRTKLSIMICEELNWRQANGRVKDRACRDVLLRMNAKGLINCPPIRLKRRRKNQGNAKRDKIIFQEPREELRGKVGDYKEVKFKMVRKTEEEWLWDYLINKYHYLGYQVIVGHYLKYLIYLDKELVGCIGFGDGVLKLNHRDKWIGWTDEERESNLRLIINNSRYLLLPWVRVKYLSSKILGKIARIIRDDWEEFYGYRPVLMETFVEIERFSGTSYKASNWIYLGRTKGKGRRGMKYFYHGREKAVYVYPLVKNVRRHLIEIKKQ